MITAVFSDVHANLLALETFLAEVEGKADAFLCLGDSVNYGPWNDECVERIAALPDVTTLAGNHEDLFLNPEHVAGEIPLVQQFTATSAANFTRRDLITDLPEQSTLGALTAVHTIGGIRVFADTEIAVDGDYLIGHSHYQYRVQRDGHVIVNPGSVGQNRERIDRVEYALYDSDDASFSFFSVPYDFAAFLDELRARRYPAACIGYYEQKWAQRP